MPDMPQIQAKPTPTLYEKRTVGPSPEFLLLETGGLLLLEDSQNLLLESSP